MAEIKSSGRSIDLLLEKVLCMNILSSDYFRDLLRLKTYHEVIDEIYVTVTHVEPWMTGNCRGPSTAFCLLYKFFTMKLTVKQMHGLLKHPNSPYIRAKSKDYCGFGLEEKGDDWEHEEIFIDNDEAVENDPEEREDLAPEIRAPPEIKQDEDEGDEEEGGLSFIVVVSEIFPFMMHLLYGGLILFMVITWESWEQQDILSVFITKML